MGLSVKDIGYTQNQFRVSASLGMGDIYLSTVFMIRIVTVKQINVVRTKNIPQYFVIEYLSEELVFGPAIRRIL